MMLTMTKIFAQDFGLHIHFTALRLLNGSSELSRASILAYITLPSVPNELEFQNDREDYMNFHCLTA